MRFKLGIRKYSWIHDLPDRRDYRKLLPKIFKLPASVDLRTSPFMPPVYDQGQAGSCTGQSCGAAQAFDNNKLGHPPYDPSRLMAYYDGRIPEGGTGGDNGAQIRDVIKGMAKYGVCRESLWPYSDSESAVVKKPSKAAYKDGLLHQIIKYQRVGQTTVEMKTCLAQGLPFVFGFTVYESFESAKVARTGIVPMPGPNEAVLGGHAVMAVGYTATKLIVRNSWGDGWGQKGYFTMPLKYVLDSNLADDLWVVQTEE
jgi:C1A family cysteine protease